MTTILRTSLIGARVVHKTSFQHPLLLWHDIDHPIERHPEYVPVMRRPKHYRAYGSTWLARQVCLDPRDDVEAPFRPLVEISSSSVREYGKVYGAMHALSSGRELWVGNNDRIGSNPGHRPCRVRVGYWEEAVEGDGLKDLDPASDSESVHEHAFTQMRNGL